jgi:hypothetical protein
VRYHLQTHHVTTIVEPGASGLNGTAGMAIGVDGQLYVASRLSKQILRFDPKVPGAKGEVFIDRLEDNPEFLLQVAL